MIPIAVVAHPRREQMAHALARSVAADVICWDVGKIGAEANHLQAWDWLKDLPTPWGVVLEDDVIPCEDFTNQLAQALAHAPTPVVSLYLPRGRPPHWQEPIARTLPTAMSQGASWLTAPAMLSCQGYAMRTELFGAPHRRRVHIRVRDHHLPIDEAMTRWLAVTGDHVSYALPSLVDHRDGPTLIEHWDGPRNGKTVLMAADCDPSGADLDEIRKSWLFGAHNDWNSTRVALEVPLTTITKENA